MATKKKNMSQQQQQSDPVKPKKIGGVLPLPVVPATKAKPKKVSANPSREAVKKSLKKTMGY